MSFGAVDIDQSAHQIELSINGSEKIQNVGSKDISAALEAKNVLEGIENGTIATLPGMRDFSIAIEEAKVEEQVIVINNDKIQEKVLENSITAVGGGVQENAENVDLGDLEKRTNDLGQRIKKWHDVWYQKTFKSGLDAGYDHGMWGQGNQLADDYISIKKEIFSYKGNPDVKNKVKEIWYNINDYGAMILGAREVKKLYVDCSNFIDRKQTEKAFEVFKSIDWIAIQDYYTVNGEDPAHVNKTRASYESGFAANGLIVKN